MSDPEYCYPPDFTVLRNKFDLRDSEDLDAVERFFVSQRLREPVPMGDFDLEHLCAIHHHLFQDVFAWAGAIRTVEISKGGNTFQFRRFIENGMQDVHKRVLARDYLADLPPTEFAREAADILGDVNYVHPFREGNGRTQVQYLKQLANKAEHQIDLTRLDREQRMTASRDAHFGNYHTMTDCIENALEPEQVRSRDRRARSRRD